MAYQSASDDADTKTKAKGADGDADLHKRGRKLWEKSRDAEEHNRNTARESIKFGRLGEQWPEKMRKEREDAGRPVLTENRLPTFSRQVVNDARQNKPGIKVHPVDSGADVKTASIYDGLIRNIEVTSNADVAYDTAVESAVDGGFGYIRLNIDWSHDDSFDKDIKIIAVPNQFSVYGDPTSRCADSSDWNNAWLIEEMDKEEFKDKYPNAEMVDWDSDVWKECTDWITENSVMVAEWWNRKEVEREIAKLSSGEVVPAEWLEGTELTAGLLPENAGTPMTNLAALQITGVTVTARRTAKSYKVTQRLMTGCEILETNEWAGQFIPIVPVYGEVIHLEGKRYLRSLYHNAMDPQAMLNFWITAATEQVALQPKAPYIGAEGAFDNDPRWDTANTENHPYMEYKTVPGANPPQRQAPPQMPAAMMQMVMAAADSIKSTLGMFNASLGQASNEVSGVAIHERKQEGDTSTFHFIDNLSRAIRHIGRMLIDLIPHVYTGERMIRVIGKDGKAQNVQLGQRPAANQNSPTNAAPGQQPQPQTQPGQPGAPEQSAEQNEQVLGPDGQPIIPAEVYDLGVGKYDLVVEAGPSYSTRRAEAAASMIELIRAFPQAASVLGDLLAKNLDWPDAETVSERLRALLPPGAQGAGASGQVQGLMKQIQDLTTQIQAMQGDKQADMMKAQTDAFSAQTERIKVTGNLQHDTGQLLLEANKQSQPQLLHRGIAA